MTDRGSEASEGSAEAGRDRDLNERKASRGYDWMAVTIALILWTTTAAMLAPPELLLAVPLGRTDLFIATLALSAGLVLSILANPAGWWTYPLSVLIVAGALLVLALAIPGGMGMGDVKMAGMLGAFLGPYAALAVFLGAAIGAVSGGVLMVAGKVQRRSHLPFGLFMALGGVISLFVGPQLWSLYLSLVA